jgi:uncharacterized membrane protein YdjX (TVP38/TMEM64 family)
MHASSTDEKRRGDWWKPIVLIGALLTVFALAKIFGIGDRLAELRHWIATLGNWGPVVFLLLYIVAVVAAIPGSAVTVAAGALFGSWLGIILVSAGSTIGAGLCFLIARFFAREAVIRWISSNERFQKLDRLTEQHGAVIVALTRLVPLFPFNLLNYGFGLTRVPFGIYLFWSWLCMLPGTALYVIGTDAFVRGLSEGKAPWGLLVTVIGVLILLGGLTYLARKRLKEKEKNTDESLSGSSAER